MKKSLLFFFLFITAIFNANSQQCLSGGCSNFVKQYPTGTFSTASSSWTLVSSTLNAGNYQLYSVTEGNTYVWSYCESDTGIPITWDPQLTLYNEADRTTSLCYVKDYCGLAPAITLKATFSGTVRLLTSAYIGGVSCQSNGTSSPWNKLVWRQSATGGGGSTTGTMNITVNNLNGTSSPLPGANGKVELFDSNYQPLNIQANTNSSGIASFANRAYGNYNIEASHTPSNPSTIFGIEFWGAISLSHNSANTSGTITRNMPYSDYYRIINVSTGLDVTEGSVPVGTPLRIEVKVKNPGTASKSVKARLVFDRDKLTGYDFDQTSSASTVSAKSGSTPGEVTLTFSYTPTIAGDYFGAKGTLTNTNGTSYPITDGSAWSTTKWLTVTAASTTGTMNITVNNLNGTSSPLPGANGKVLLYDANYNYLNKQANTNSSGVASFSSLAYGTYFFEAYHSPTNPATIFGDEFWGAGSLSHKSANSQGTVTRDMPYSDYFRIVNVSTGQDVTGGSVPTGTQLRIEVKVKNPGTASKTVKARFVFDRNKDTSYDLDQTSSTGTVSAKSGSTPGEVTFSFNYTPILAGDYYGITGTMANTNGTSYPYTDGAAWGTIKALTVTATLPTGGLTVTVKNVPVGNASLPGTNGFVELYKNGEIKPFDWKQTNVNGIATFSGIPIGDAYFYKVYHSSENAMTPFEKEYWGINTGFKINANQVTSSTFTRNQPYGGDISVFNGTTDVTGQTVEPGSNLTAKYTIYNPSSNSIRARGNIYIDESKSYQWDYSIQGQLQTIPANGSIIQNIPFITKSGGTFYAAGTVNIESISTEGITLFTDNKMWAEEPIFKVASSPWAINLLEVLTNMADKYDESDVTKRGRLKYLYDIEERKVFAYISKGVAYEGVALGGGKIGVDIYIDLADYYSAMHPEDLITKEGAQGWVTIYINARVGYGFDAPSIYPFSFGFASPEKFYPPLNDPKKEFSFSALSSTSPFWKTTLIKYSENGWGKVEATSEGVFNSGIGFDFAKIGINVYRLEIRKSELDNRINNAFMSGFIPGGTLGKTQIEKAIIVFASSMVDFNGEKVNPSKSISSSNIQRFSSNDDGENNMDGAINFLNGGIDINGDGIRDNYYPVVPENYFYMPEYQHKAELFIQNTGKAVADFDVIVKNVPKGWFIGADDGGLLTPLNDNKYKLEDVDFRFGKNEKESKWAIACLKDAPEEARLTFELWQRTSPFSTLIQSKEIILRKFHYAPEKNNPPTISSLNEYFDISLPAKSHKIGWNDSDPDDNAHISIAIDPDLSDNPWDGPENHFWIAKDIQEDPEGEGDIFLWDSTGQKPGRYTLWAVISDGINEPQYTKCSSEIIIGKDEDTIDPFAEIKTSLTNWFSKSPVFDIDFKDNQALDNTYYQVLPKTSLNKSANLTSSINEIRNSDELQQSLEDNSNWHTLTSNGLFLLPGSQNNLGKSLTDPWKISNTDWEFLVNNSKSGEKYYLYLKATDDAGNIFVTKDETKALEIKIDLTRPHIKIEYPSDGQRIDSRISNVKWLADDVTDGIELSGLDSIYIALDQSNDFIRLNGTETSYTFNNLSDGIHNVYLKSKDKAGNFSDLKLTQFSVNSSISIAAVDISRISDITMRSVHIGGIITDDKGVEIISKGVCWSKDINPTIALSTKTESGTGNGIFSTKIAELEPGVTYHIRAYATNCAGTSYSDDVKFTTNSSALSPSITTTDIQDISSTSAKAGGYIISEGVATITAMGVCWSISLNPTISDSRTSEVTGTLEFSSNVDGLSPGITYHLRAYATNSIGTSYGEDVSFTTLPNEVSKTVKDIDGNEYTTVTIGTQVWLGQNLKATKYNDGTSIPLVTDNNTWSTFMTPAYSWYNNDIGNKNPYGALYNWYSVNTRKLCPTGWHVPSDSEWTIFTNYLGGTSISGGKLKEDGLTHWLSPNSGAINSTNFSALPGGNRNYYSGNFYGLGYGGDWWSNTDDGSYNAWHRSISYDNSGILRLNPSKSYGFSVRCLCDLLTSSKDELSNKNNIVLYPNPTKGLVYISSDKSIEVEVRIEVYNNIGLLLQSKNISLWNNTTQIDLSGFTPGIYLIKIYTKNISFVSKILKQ